MKKGKKIYEGKAKIIFATEDKNLVIQHFKDDATAYNNQKKDIIEGKGILNNRISEHILSNLNQVGIKNHLIKRINMREQLVKSLEIIPIEFIVRNIAAGSIVKTTHLSEGTLIQPPIVEFFLKDDSKNDPLLTPDRVRLMGHDPEPLITRTKEINYELQSLFTLMGIDLVDFKLEYGYDVHGDLFLADELSPDNMRLWKRGTKERFDKDLFRKDEGDIVEAYKYILQHLRQFA